MTTQQDTGTTATYVRTADIPLDELTPFPGNAKRGNVQQIRTSLRRNGQYRSLVVREIPNGPLIVLAGNHTMQALQAEGRETARCEVVLCDDDTARRINLADNRTAELGEYDNDALAELLSYLDGDLEGTGYTQDDVDHLLDYPEDPEALTDPDDTPEPPTDPISKPGDVWILGPHRVLCGDSTDITAVEAMLNGDRADCMWTDPPYGVDYVGKTKDALTIQNDGAADLPELLAGAFGGSGSTLIAAHTLGRVARVCELDPRYVDVICRRYQQHTGAQPVLASTGEAHDFTAEPANP